MLACGSASEDGVTTHPNRTWSGFHGVPLVTTQRVRLNIHMWRGGKDAPRNFGTPSVRTAVYAHVVADATMSHAVLLGRDSRAHFPVKKYRDVFDLETVVTFEEGEHEKQDNDDRFTKWVDNAVGMVEQEGDGRVMVKCAGKKRWLPNTMSWIQVHLTNIDGSEAAEGVYNVRFSEGWFPREQLVEAGTSEIPMRRVGDTAFQLQRSMYLGEGGMPLEKCNLDNAQLFPNDEFKAHVVSESNPVSVPSDKPPNEVMTNLNSAQQVSFRKLWQRIPLHLRDIKFDFEGDLWQPEDIDRLGDNLCKYDHRFSKDGTDLGRVTIDPFRIVLKPGAQPLKQRPYRYSPVIQEKAQIEIDKLLLAGVLRRSYSNWASPLVVVANGGVRLTVIYRRVNDMSVIPRLPIPIAEEILADLRSAKVFSTLDSVSGFFQCSIHEDSIPITAVISASGLYEFKSMPQGLSSSPGWFQSVMARVCEALDRVRLFIDDVIVYSDNGGEHVRDLEKFFERMVRFNLKLASKKTTLGVRQVVFWGHKVTAKGIEPDEATVKTMLRLPMPTNVSTLRSTLGSLSYYRKFLKGMSKKLQPVTELLKKNVKFVLTAEHQAILQEMLDKLSSPEVLVFRENVLSCLSRMHRRMVWARSLSRNRKMERCALYIT